AVQAGRGDRVVRICDEDDPCAERDLAAADRSWIPRAVPAFMVVQHPVGDRVDAEALEHPVSDLRMTLQHEPFGAGEGTRLAEDFLGDGELPQIVQASREAD